MGGGAGKPRFLVVLAVHEAERLHGKLADGVKLRVPFGGDLAAAFWMGVGGERLGVLVLAGFH